jgi:heme-degrading monooxygenase HmoA
MAMTFFDADQAATVSRDWTRARDGMTALGGYRYAALFTSMDWERTSTLMGMSLWDDAEAAGRGLAVAEAQVPARAWARTGTYRRVAYDGDMRDSVFQSVVMVLPIPAAIDSAKAEGSFVAANTYMKTQPGYMASVLFRRVAGDPTHGHLIVSRWATRENLQAAAQSQGFQDLRPTLEFGSGQATTYLQLMY